jgi:hypothetical protein
MKYESSYKIGSSDVTWGENEREGIGILLFFSLGT